MIELDMTEKFVMRDAALDCDGIPTWFTWPEFTELCKGLCEKGLLQKRETVVWFTYIVEFALTEAGQEWLAEVKA